jgi:hypothetical protein
LESLNEHLGIELKDEDPAEKEVLAAFYDKRELSPSELVQRVITNTSQLTDIDIKRAVWHLIAKGEIRLSAEQ